MGGGGSPAPPQVSAPVPTAADEEAAAERARLYSMLRSRRGIRGLGYGARRRRGALAEMNPLTALPIPAAQTQVMPATSRLLLGDPGSGIGGGPSDFGGGDGGGFSDPGDPSGWGGM